MLDRRIKLSTVELLSVPADAIVVEDSSRLSALRGLAATVDGLDAGLRRRREEALAQHGGPFAIGTALGFQLESTTHPFRHVIWAITFAQVPQPEGQPERLERATPLDVAAATRSALLEAEALGVKHLAMPAIGTRTDQHVLPPAPKKLPRYVMGAAQLIALQQTLDETRIEQVTLSLSLRDHAIFHDLLGLPLATVLEETTDE
jgi:O-acetyl-ADP-ribose deacetylase (regulator of RNase III)